jgi:hypothetical protein
MPFRVSDPSTYFARRLALPDSASSIDSSFIVTALSMERDAGSEASVIRRSIASACALLSAASGETGISGFTPITRVGLSLTFNAPAPGSLR